LGVIRNFKLSFYFIFTAVAVALFGASTAEASTVRALSLEGLVVHSHIVVFGEAYKMDTHRDEHGYIVRSFNVRVRDYLVGSGQREITVRLAGGSLDGRGRLVPGEAELSLNEGVILFLERVTAKPMPFYVVAGMAQGRFAVNGDPTAGGASVTRELGDLNLVGDVDDRVMGLGRANTSTFIPYEEFVEAIRRLAADLDR